MSTASEPFGARSRWACWEISWERRDTRDWFDEVDELLEEESDRAIEVAWSSKDGWLDETNWCKEGNWGELRSCDVWGDGSWAWLFERERAEWTEGAEKTAPDWEREWEKWEALEFTRSIAKPFCKECPTLRLLAILQSRLMSIGEWVDAVVNGVLGVLMGDVSVGDELKE
jgi:hypothetical protein